MNATDTAVMETVNNTMGLWMTGVFGFIFWFAMFASAIFIFSIIWQSMRGLGRGGANIIMGKGDGLGSLYARNRSIQKWHDRAMRNAAKYGYKSRY